MWRALLLLTLSMWAFPVYADPLDDIEAAIFEKDRTDIQAKYRKCAHDTDCTTLMSLCRWRTVNNASVQYVKNVSDQLHLECKWPPPPPTAPIPRCMSQLCIIPPDHKYY